MALIKLGGMIAEIRGSVGGATFARNRGGAYVRNRSVPLNPASVDQSRVRAVFGGLAQAWSAELTQTQREAWELYAANVPLPNSLGELRQVTGLNMYQRSNSLIIDTGGARLDAAPTEFTVGPSFTPTYTITPATNTITVESLGSFVPSLDGPIRVLFQMGTPQSPGVSFFKAPFRKIGGQEFVDEATDFPLDLAAAFPFQTGQAVFLRAAPVTLDGRVGVPIVSRFLAA